MSKQLVLIPSDEQGMAVVAHLSGLAGYFLPLGGILAPIAIWMACRRSSSISAIAKQAIALNVVVFISVFILGAVLLQGGGIHVAGDISIASAVVGATLITLFLGLGAGAFVLPIVGAVKASQGEYYRYPIVGIGVD